ncbi:Nucleotidyltransferase [Pleurotus eryngii]|uniref:DNA polymerase n=1 Tax=Pleurotus eryngii TaxID=5323 RepID=A0A9P6A8V0_PLEER|nr:Nucleotidyltransferase [Pleurotus eryngii]
MKRTRTSRSSSYESVDSDMSTCSSFKRLKHSESDEESDDSGFPIKVFVVQAKLSPEEISGLISMVEQQQSMRMLELCSIPAEADVIVTGIQMKKRLERHISWQLAKRRAIVSPQWIKDSVAKEQPMPCGDYAAIQELHDETVHNCPNPKGCDECSGTSQPEAEVAPSSLSYKARYACQRASPLVCANQSLAEEIDILRRARELEGEAMSALAYERTVAVIKAYPHVISPSKLESDLAKISGVGKKVQVKIEEYLTTGQILEAREILASQRFRSLSEFNTIYGIGPVTARQLYDKGMSTLEHLDSYYDIRAHNPVLEEQTNPNIIESQVKRLSTKGIPEVTIQVGLALRHDLSQKIPREEVRDMHDFVMKELESLQHGCVSTIVGGYRRGKEESNDVDIVISHKDWRGGGEKIKGLCTRLVKHLYDKGPVTHVMHLSSFRPHNALRTGHWDSLEKALTIFRLPQAEGTSRIHRRLDLIFASPETYWTAVTGWTGSKMFERDLRLWAKYEKGYKFDSTGITRRHDSKLFYPKSEQEVFEILGLEWVDPTLRNTGV